MARPRQGGPNMAVTGGHGNPKWNREETILALDLYNGFEGGIGSKSSEEVLELSNFLRNLPYHQTSKKNDTFRNVDGVYFKLQNLRSALTGEGLNHTSKMDKAIATEFGDKPEEVARLAKLIRASAKILTPEDYEVTDDFEDEFHEGKSVFASHRRTERNKKLRGKFLRRLDDADLKCGICGLERPHLNRSVHESLFELHHVLPLSENTGARITRLSDVVLLCASCHRAIHKLMAEKKRFVGIDEAAEVLVGRVK